MPNKTFGAKTVGFTATDDEVVHDINLMYAGVIDALNNLRTEASSSEQVRIATNAITAAEDAQMWAVKAAMWRD